MPSIFARGAIVLAGVFSALTLSAEPAVPADGAITADQAVQMALEHNFSLQRTSWDLDAKLRQKNNAWGVFVPSPSVSSTLSRPNSGTMVSGSSTAPHWSITNSVSLSLTLSASAFSTWQTVQLNYRTGQITYALARRSLEKSVRLAFASLLLERENLQLTRDTIQLKQQSLADAQKKFQSGLSPELDVFSARVNLESLQPTLAQQEASYENDLGQLKVLLGLPLSQNLDLSGSLDQPIESQVDLRAAYGVVPVSPDVQQAQMALESAQLSRETTQASAWFPTASLTWSYAPSTTLTSGAAWSDTGTFAVQLSYALNGFLPWTTTTESVTEAQEAVRSRQSELAETEASSALTRQNALRQIQQAEKSLQSQTLSVELAQKTYDLNLVAYQRGTKDLLALQNSESDLNQARYALLSQRYTLLSTVIALEYELGVPFGTLLGGHS